MEGRCYCCGKPGHKSPTCRHKNKPKDEWAINKAEINEKQQNTQTGKIIEVDIRPIETASTVSNKKDDTTAQEINTVGWAGAHFSFLQSLNMKDEILLDTASSASLFGNKDYVSSIQESNGTLELQTNGGSIVSKQSGQVDKFGTVWYNPNSVANIFSFAEMKRIYRITYDSEVEDAFVVHTPTNEVRFKPLSNGLYSLNPKRTTEHPPTTAMQFQFMNTLEENKKFFTPRQFERAKLARDLFHSLGCPSLKNLKGVIRMNMIRDNPVTTKDVDLAESIFGPDIGTVKGKMTRSRPTPVNDQHIEIPEEMISLHEDVTLAIDGITINSLKFLSTISRDIYYRTVHYMPDTKAVTYRTAINDVCGVYRRGGFQVTDILCDNEFHASLDPIAAARNPPIHVHYAAAQEHVPEAERNNRVIKEQFRAVYHRLPFTHLPRILVKYLTYESARKPNIFPARQGVSKYYSPRMIVHQENLSYANHCQTSCGNYVLAHNEPNQTSTNAPRALDCLYLRPTASGRHECLHLQTNRVITRSKVTSVPITPAIITLVNTIATADGMPEGLKITNRFGTILYDSSWIAGVDHKDNEDQDHEDDQDYNDDDNDEENDEDAEDDLDQMDPNEVAEILQDQAQTPGVDDPHQANNAGVDEPAEQEEFANEEEEIVFEEVEQEVEQDTPAEEEQQRITTRTGRTVRPPNRLIQAHQYLNHENAMIEEYTEETAQVIATVMSHWNNQCQRLDDKELMMFIQTYSLNKGLKKFGQKGKDAVMKEMKQLHKRTVFEPILIEHLTPLERKRAMESLLFLVEKRDKKVKARTCANGSTQREYIEREDASSPTAATETILITGVIEAKQRRDIMTNDVPNAFVQTPVPQDGDKIIMKIRGQLVDILTEIAPETYHSYIVYEGKKKQKVLYVRMLKALYGMLIASLLYYKKFRADIEGIGFIVNPYDPCVANRKVKGKQHTVTWHVDDLKSSHVDPKVNNQFHGWLEKTYGSDDIGHVEATRGPIHNYLAMQLDYSTPGILKVDMREYLKTMLDDFPYEIKGKQTVPWNEKLFKVDESPKLDDAKRETFHSFVMKAMFICKRGRSDVQPAISFLASRVTQPNQSDWNKLIRVLTFLKTTKEEVLTLEADDTQILTWYIDAAFAVHHDMRSHTGSTFSLGKGMIVSDSTKQKVNSRSSTEAELIGVDDRISKVLWVKRFIEYQGFKINLNLIYQDSTSSMRLENNGKWSSGKRTRHFDIKYFYVTDLIGRDEVAVLYCPTDDMIADYTTKPLTGTKFHYFRDIIMNLSNKTHHVGQQECVGNHARAA
jgi:hypothetical protein